MIVRVTLRDGTYHEVRCLGTGLCCFGADFLLFSRISVTVTSKIARERLPLLKRPRRKGLQMLSSVH